MQREKDAAKEISSPASSSDTGHIKLNAAAERVCARPDLAFGCVTIAERHLAKAALG